MGTNTTINRQKAPQAEPSPYWQEVFIIIIICASISGVGIYVVNMNRQIAILDKARADLVSTIERNKTTIENLKTQQERLKTEKVIAFAMRYNMTTPMEGQVCVVSPNDIAPRGNSDVMYARNRQQNTPFNVATVQKR